MESYNDNCSLVYILQSSRKTFQNVASLTTDIAYQAQPVVTLRAGFKRGCRQVSLFCEEISSLVQRLFA